MTLEEYLGDWIQIIDKETLQKALNIIGPLYSTKSIVPKTSDVLKAFNLCPYKELKVVFVCQEPYNQVEEATGIAFGNKSNTSSISASLNYLKNVCIDYTIPHNHIDFDNSLESWAKQGVLLLNSSLTVECGKKNTHINIWKPFTVSLLKNLSKYNSGIIYILEDKRLNYLKPYIQNNNTIYTGIFPKLFVSLNQELNKKYGKPITWFTEY